VSAPGRDAERPRRARPDTPGAEAGTGRKAAHAARQAAERAAERAAQRAGRRPRYEDRHWAAAEPSPWEDVCGEADGSPFPRHRRNG
jgi:sRNA-binding protein